MNYQSSISITNSDFASSPDDEFPFSPTGYTSNAEPDNSDDPTGVTAGVIDTSEEQYAQYDSPTLNDDYVLITLYVDDKTPLPEKVTVQENGSERILRTVGDKWSYLQRVKFGANAQPFYVLIDNEGMPLNKSYSYDEDVDKYVDFLQTGLNNYKKNK